MFVQSWTGDFLTQGSARKFRFDFSLWSFWLFLLIADAWFLPPAAFADGGAFEMLEQKVEKIQSSNRVDGWAYLISGGVALGISIPSYYISNDVFAKGVYSLAETLSVASVGYGAYLLLVDDDLTRFVRIVKSTPQLSKISRDQLATRYLQENADRAKNVRKIRVISHGLTAALNFVNAATASQTDLATALYFLGGVNTLAAVSFAVSKSDDEKIIDSMSKSEPRAELEFFAGPISGVTLHF